VALAPGSEFLLRDGLTGSTSCSGQSRLWPQCRSIVLSLGCDKKPNVGVLWPLP
jgi:hypothetical protein